MSTFYEDDEDPQAIREAFDHGPKGVTADERTWAVLGSTPLGSDIVEKTVERVLGQADEARRRSSGTVPVPSRVLTCRCDVVETGVPGSYCGAHDRAARYTGPPVRAESDGPVGPW